MKKHKLQKHKLSADLPLIVALALFLSVLISNADVSKITVSGLAASISTPKNCLVQIPTVLVSPQTTKVFPGKTFILTLLIKNNDKNCGSSSFSVNGFVGTYGFVKPRGNLNYGIYQVYPSSGVQDKEVILNIKTSKTGTASEEITVNELELKDSSEFPISVFPLDVNGRGGITFDNVLMFIHDKSFNVRFLGDQTLTIESSKSVKVKIEIKVDKKTPTGNYNALIVVYNADNPELYSYKQVKLTVKKSVG